VKKWICAVLSILLVLSMSACQPTPDKSVVGNKDTDKLIYKATGGTSSVAETGLAAKAKEAKDTGKKLTEVLNAPKTLTKTLTSKSSKMTVNIKADVDVPDLSALPTVRVAKKSISQSDIEKLSSSLLGGASLYNVSAVSMQTKAEIQTEILRLKAKLAKASKSDKANIQLSIDKYEQIYKDAPESNALTKIPLSFTKQDGADLIEGITDHSDGKYKYFQAVNMSSANFFQVFYTCETSQYCLDLQNFYKAKGTGATSMGKMQIDINQINKLPALKTTKEQAQTMAGNVVKALGLNNFTCALNQAVDGGSQLQNSTTFLRHAYELQYVRTINSAAMTYVDNTNGSNDYRGAAKNAEQTKKSDASYAASWAPESITFFIDDTGIVKFQWRSPVDVKDTITKNTALLPFSDISSIFDQMIYVKCADSRAIEKQNKSTLNITKVKLGLMRVLEQNKDTGLIIPVWDFFGSKTSEGSSYKDDDPSYSFLTINAIDGSIIDRAAGY